MLRIASGIQSLLWLCFFSSVSGRLWENQHVLVVDAGSTGSRLFVFRIDALSGQIQEFRGDKISPGISEFGRNLSQVADYMRPLFDGAARFIPKEQHLNTYVFIKGTAGMRLLPPQEQEDIYDALVAGLTSDPTFPFRLRRKDHGTVSGEMEGYYGALAANYLAGRVNASLMLVPGEKGVIGSLDMGGSSTQIVLHSNPLELAHAPLEIERFETRSFLSLGTEKLRERVFDLLRAKAKGKTRMFNPCGWRGHEVAWGDADRVVLVGSAQPDECVKLIKLAAFGDSDCTRNTCAVPEVGLRFKVQGEFLAMSNFFFAMHFVHTSLPSGIPRWPKPTIQDMLTATESVCSWAWADARRNVGNKHAYTSSNHAPFRCLEALYISVLLRDGYGILPHEQAVTFSLELNGMEVGWPLGSALATRFYKLRKYQQRMLDAAENFIPEMHLAEFESVGAWQSPFASLDGSYRGVLLSSILALVVMLGLALAFGNSSHSSKRQTSSGTVNKAQ